MVKYNKFVIERKYDTITDFKVALPREERPKKATQLVKPDDIKLKKKEYWCPYCANAVEFKNDSSLGVKRCIYCGISDNDYYVRNANNLWKKI